MTEAELEDDANKAMDALEEGIFAMQEFTMKHGTCHLVDFVIRALLARVDADFIGFRLQEIDAENKRLGID
jgi:chromosome condensin MukBEF complex kleisin-like MukF subunit